MQLFMTGWYFFAIKIHSEEEKNIFNADFSVYFNNIFFIRSAMRP